MPAIRSEDLIKLNPIIFDIEGSGCVPGSTPYASGSIVSLGAVDFNTKDEFYEECMVMDGRSYDDYALKINGFTKAQIFDNNKQSVLELVKKFEEFCTAHNSSIIAAWGDYDLKMLYASYSHYGEEIKLPSKYLNLKNVSKAVMGSSKPGLSNTAIKLGVPPETYPHTGINGARLASEVTSLMLFGRHFYEGYKIYPIKVQIKDSIALNAVEIVTSREHKREKAKSF
ncbi:MAG: 3'-5' exoribonuclease [Methanothrix sp.]